MIRFAGQQALFTSIDISASKLTLYFHISPNAVSSTTAMYLWSAISGGDDQYSIYIANSNLYVQYGCDKNDGTVGVWYCAISLQEQLLAVNMTVTGSATTPIVYINGTAQTMTLSSTLEEGVALPTGRHTIGNDTYYEVGSTNVWNGRISEVAAWNANLTAQQMIQLTKAKVRRLPLQIQNSSLLYYFPMDSVPDGLYCYVSTNLVANGDINTNWTYSGGGTRWNSIAADDTYYILADDGDDGTLYDASLTTFTIPTGKTVYGFVLYAEGLQDAADFTVAIYKADATLLTAVSIAASSKTGYYAAYVGNLSQSDIDGLYIECAAPSTIDKDEEVRVYYVRVTPYYANYHIKSLKGNLELYGFGGSGGVNKYLSLGD